jgi:DNA-binding NarL/FixJ family response regulator
MRILVVDDHELVRQGIMHMLRDVERIEVVGGAASGEEAIALIRTQPVDVVLMDINMPGMGGLEATRKILRLAPGTKVIIVTICEDDPFPSTLLAAGAAGYLTKGTPLPQMIQAIKSVHKGQRFISPDIAQHLALKSFDPANSNPFEHLSERELQISMMIVQCQKVAQIAEQLFLSPKTVNSYRYRVFEKLAIESDVELTLLAVRHGLIHPMAQNPIRAVAV